MPSVPDYYNEEIDKKIKKAKKDMIKEFGLVIQPIEEPDEYKKAWKKSLLNEARRLADSYRNRQIKCFAADVYAYLKEEK